MKISNLKTFVFSILLVTVLQTSAQQKDFNPAYQFKHTASVVQDKNFYLLTLIEQTPEINKIIKADNVMSAIT